MTTWETITWYVARAGGFTAYALLAIAVLIGLSLTMQWQTARWPRLVNSELHNFLTLLALVFTCVHVLAVWVDPFTHFSWMEIFVPFVSHYRPFWMALGIVGLYLGAAIGISTWLRPMIGYTLWRRLHVFTLGVYGLVTIHGLATGSDTRTWWAIAMYAVSLAAVTLLLVMRLLTPLRPHGRAHPVLAALTALTVVIILAWAMAGPLQAGWSTAAGGQSTFITANAINPGKNSLVGLIV